MMIGAAWAIIVFAAMPTTVRVPAPQPEVLREFLPLEVREVHNVGLMHRKSNHLMLAGIMFIGGCILAGAGALSSGKHNRQRQHHTRRRHSRAHQSEGSSGGPSSYSYRELVQMNEKAENKQAP
ncbi:hypothetical protein [Coralloluteibacterium stylophorae]|uniref:Uncharacterized protein n=1 Tax=Coralloluteibacterium stylophorae TaxID=1776034 RepID=A0A8J7VTJ5_9GAMM|nr:hypothetical protein [Coralloluteibacterium stylophorae]MBS7459037.1 hypothetical protein [Coralloluteibacterium stylophorae]